MEVGQWGPELCEKEVEELLKEAKRGKARAETMGPMGWMKCPLAGTNKRFLINTIKNTLPSHKEQDHEQKIQCCFLCPLKYQTQQGMLWSFLLGRLLFQNLRYT